MSCRVEEGSGVALLVGTIPSSPLINATCAFLENQNHNMLSTRVSIIYRLLLSWSCCICLLLLWYGMYGTRRRRSCMQQQPGEIRNWMKKSTTITPKPILLKVSLKPESYRFLSNARWITTLRAFTRDIRVPNYNRWTPTFALNATFFATRRRSRNPDIRHNERALSKTQLKLCFCCRNHLISYFLWPK